MAIKIVGSNMPDSPAAQMRPTKRNYGQNGFGGASSDMPGEHTASGFLPQPGAPVNSQTRKVTSDPYPPAHGMRKRGVAR